MSLLGKGKQVCQGRSKCFTNHWCALALVAHIPCNGVPLEVSP